MSEFWEQFLKSADLGEDGSGSLDAHLSGKEAGGPEFEVMQSLTDAGRAKNALDLPVEEGTRVEFAGMLGAVMAYSNPPEPKERGTVVQVKSASGMVTAHNGMVFVKWDGSGDVLPIHAEHLRRAKGRVKRQAARQMRVASLGDLTDFLKVADDTLVHKSTKDLWTFRQDGSEYVIERLFDSDGEPIKA